MIKRVLILLYEWGLRKYTMFLDFISKIRLGTPKVMSVGETINYIKENHCSISRYGDGELKIVSGKDIRFQEYDSNLAERLKIILKGNGNTLVCISNIFKDLHWMNKKAYEYTWRIVAENRKQWTSFLNLDYTYGNAFISRPYFDWKDKSKTQDWFDSLKELWENQDIVFIEGSKSRLGYGNDLFEEAKSIKRILCPTKNAYSVYDKILEEAKKQPKEVLYLLALGPTATVLAEDLAKEGYWVIDIGHLDIEYEWFRLNTVEKIPIKNKYTNEAVTGEYVDDDVNEEYKKQVIAVIN